MDTAAAMSSEWMPSRVSLGRELPEMLNASFASVKHETHVNGEAKRQGIISEEREKIAPGGKIISTDNKTETSNGPHCRLSPMRINHRAQIDVIDMREEDLKIYKHLLIYEEQYSKFVVLKALRSADPWEVAVELVDIVTTIGAPRIIQSGNGRDYAEQVVREIRILLRDFCVVHGDAAKNGEIRRDFKGLTKSWMEKNPGKTWHEGLKTIQVVENTTLNSRNGTAPSQLFFGRNICDDLRRTIGGKGSLGNTATDEDSVSAVSKERYSFADSNKDPVPVSISRAVEIAKESENYSRDIEYRKELDKKSLAAKEKINSFNLVRVKSEFPSGPDNDEVLHSDAEERVDSEKYNFRCKICQKQYMKLGHLRNHTKTHTRVGSYECTICCKSFRLSSLYDKHMQRFHEDDKNATVETCERLEETERDDENNERVNKEKESSAKKRRCMKKKSKPIKSVPDERKKSPSSLTSLRSSAKKPSKRLKSVFRRKLNNTTSQQNSNPLLECTYCKQKFNFPSVLKRHVRSHTNERPYVCQVCGKSFKQLGHLSQHSLTHTDYRSFQCTICDIKFDSLDSFKLHSQSHKDEAVHRPKETYRLFECDSCKKVFTTKSVLERHIFTHSHERQFGCKVCGKRFKQAGHVKSHMLVHTGERKFVCTVCSKRFSLSNSLKKHMYVHNGDKPYQCDVCGARFLEKRNLNGHLMTHTNERPFSCKICGKRYTLADTLRRHISAAHEDGRTYQCEICAKMFKQLAHLSVHKKVHNDERPFQCHLCEKNFKHKNVLKSHLAIHANVRPFECDVCKATFVRKTNLQTHIASAHMNERPYVCTICNKRFKQISHLNGHIVVHSNSMPYQCDFCDRRCNRLDNLKKHMRLHTKNKE